MKIYLYLANKFVTFTLPTEISGSFSFDENEEEDDKLINVEARDNKWYLYSTNESKIMENYNFDIQEELKKLPTKPGVYIMHDEKDHIIYVGKAINLKNRVRQYFQTSRNKGVKIEQMVTHIRRFEYGDCF